ncbi:MAG: glycosyltransferase [Candidatus Paceibacterota bacterium]
MNLLSIGTDRKLFEDNSAVLARQIEYAKKFEKVFIVVFTKKGFQKKEIDNITIYPTNSSSKFFYIRDAIRIGKGILTKPSTFTCQNFAKTKFRQASAKPFTITCQDPFECGFVGYKLKKRMDVPLELQIHTDIGSDYFASLKIGFKLWFLNSFRICLANRILPKADHIRVVSERNAVFLKEYMKIPAEKIEVRPIAVDVEKIKNAVVKPENDLRKKYPQFDKIVLIASRLEPEKNIKSAVLAFKTVVKTFPKAGLIIVGSGSLLYNLKRTVARYSLDSNVILEPWQSDLSSYYKTCDIFLNVSFYEGYGMTMVEAKAAGAKILSTDVGIAKEIGAGITGFEPREIGDKLLELLNQ